MTGTSVSLAQDEQPTTENQEKLAGFEWLKQFEGTWSTAFNGTMKSQVAGNIWMVNELSFETGMSAVQSIGYDAGQKHFVGTWIDSSSSFTWQYTGSLDESGKILTLETEGPDMADPKKSRLYRDTYEFRSENEIAAESKMLNDNGEWKTLSTGTMTRKAQSNAGLDTKTTVTPFLMFTGQAEAAINFYKTVFPDTQVASMTRYEAGERGAEGTVMVATFVIAGQPVMCTDSAVHQYDFTPSFSFFVECENEDQLKERFEKLSDGGEVIMPLDNYGFSQQFGWVSDKFGGNWQLNLKRCFTRRARCHNQNEARLASSPGEPCILFPCRHRIVRSRVVDIN